MSYDHLKQKQLNLEHRLNPEAGDYWEDHMVGVCIVLAVTQKEVTVCREKTRVDYQRWTWDLSSAYTMTRLEFSRLMVYGGTGPLAEATWAAVHPKAHQSFAYDWAAMFEKLGGAG